MIEGQSAKYLTAGDGFVAWVGYLDGVLWAFSEADATTGTIADPDDPITAIDAAAGEVAWVTESGRLSVDSVALAGEAEPEVYELGRAGRHIAFDAQTVFVGDEEGLMSVSRDTGEIVVISTERIGAVAINTGTAFFLIEDRATIFSLDRAENGSSATPMFDEVEDNAIYALAVDESDIFWLDGRVVKRSLQTE